MLREVSRYSPGRAFPFYKFFPKRKEELNRFRLFSISLPFHEVIPFFSGAKKMGQEEARIATLCPFTWEEISEAVKKHLFLTFITHVFLFQIRKMRFNEIWFTLVFLLSPPKSIPLSTAPQCLLCVIIIFIKLNLVSLFSPWDMS